VRLRPAGLPTSEAPAIQGHISSCPDCQNELETLRSVVNQFVSWPTDVLRPRHRCRGGLHFASRGDGKSAGTAAGAAVVRAGMEQVAPGIECKLPRDRHAKAPRQLCGTPRVRRELPAHTHAGEEDCISSNGDYGSTTQADAVPLRVGREQLAFDPGRDLFPFRLGPLPRPRQYRLISRPLRDAKCKPPLQRCRWTQHVGGPGDD